ncbi:putative alcohol dehydrogenase [Actinoplanes missouriensis 431]|uniref:Putative alcohol dehydrogenase n=1 Tax=Actinoplanes missouriensis (strain ATCC 14538 / DSM 43046 / CBS 188.64 / JCM 3121 / NBRC 102363 / NCIMB 12654 / NRRL B-3342 / UNCC 431) TaxID=512565 RepID=I0H7N9_ACTM4|nr:NADP-dependent oxidoreductase [Actinoplanes missouriensis]BAL89026.1 putative alcohol dehydrogenase [Actinoplanes missouriensis 431]
MRAITQQRFGGAEVLQVAEVPRPEPLPTEVLVRVVAAGLNPVDVKTREGGGMAGVLGEPPFILGWDVSGVVEAVGFGVHTLKPGDEVYGMPWFPRQAGGYAEYVTAPSRHFARRPLSISHEASAAVPLAALTAWQALTAATTVKPGQRVLIHAAAGGVGHFAVQFAKHLGAHVIGTARSGKHAWLRSIGADEVVDYTAVRFEDAVRDVDLVIDLVGDEETGLRSLETLTPGGLLIAVPSGVAGSIVEAAGRSGKSAIPFLVESDGPALAEIGRLIDAGVVRVEVAEVFPLDRAGEAHRALETGRTRGKIVLTV